jgi:hypothetical protein
MAAPGTRLKWLTPQLVVGILCGGLGGQVLHLFVNRERPTVLTYVLTTTSTGTTPEVKALIPDLEIRIGQSPVPTINIHVLEITAKGPFLESAPVAVTFPGATKIYGLAAEAPTDLQTASCLDTGRGLRCTLSNLDESKGRPFRIRFATDAPGPPVVETSGRQVRIQSLQQALDADKWVKDRTDTVMGVLSSFFFLIIVLYLAVSYFLGKLSLRVSSVEGAAERSRLLLEVERNAFEGKAIATEMRLKQLEEQLRRQQ